MQDLEKFKNEMNLSGKNVYVGHRYVPKIFGEWDKTKLYEPLSIVQYQGTSYTSRQYVPVGVEITNEEFWVVTGNYNAQVEQYRQDVVGVKNDLANKASKDELGVIDETLKLKKSTYENVAALKNADVEIGEVVSTNGYYSKGDNGEGIYLITETGVDNGGTVITLNNGTYAKLLYNNTVSTKQFGITNDNTTENNEKLIAMMNDSLTYDITIDDMVINDEIPVLKNILKGNFKVTGNGSLIQAKKQITIENCDIEALNGYTGRVIQVKGDFVKIKDVYIYYYNHEGYALPGNFTGIYVSPFAQTSEKFYFNTNKGVHGLKVMNVRIKKAGVALHVNLDQNEQWFTASAFENCIFSWFNYSAVKIYQNNANAIEANSIGGITFDKCEFTDNLTADYTRYGLNLINTMGIDFTNTIIFSDGDDVNFYGVNTLMPFFEELKKDTETGLFIYGVLNGRFTGCRFINCSTDGIKAFNGYEHMMVFTNSFNFINTEIPDKRYYFNILETNKGVKLNTSVADDIFEVNEKNEIFTGYPITPGNRSVEITLPDELKNSCELYVNILMNRTYTKPVLDLLNDETKIGTSIYEMKPWGITSNDAMYRFETTNNYDKLKINFNEKLAGPDYIIHNIIVTNKLTTNTKAYLKTYVVNEDGLNLN